MPLREGGKPEDDIAYAEAGRHVLATDVVVMSPRPGRVVARFDSPFARESERQGSRALKSDASFVALREKVLGLILDGAPQAA